MIQRKQTLYLLAAIIMTVICLCMQIGSFKAAGLELARVYNLWYTDPLGKHHFDTWPLMAILLPTAVLGTYAIFLYHNRKVQALFCLFNHFSKNCFCLVGRDFIFLNDCYEAHKLFWGKRELINRNVVLV